MRLCLGYIICLTMLVSSAYAADPATDPAVVEARAAYEAARLKLTNANRRLNGAQLSLDNARDDRTRAQRELAGADDREAQLRATSDSAESDARRLKTDRDRVAKQVSEFDGQLADTKKALGESQSAIDKATKAAEQRFSRSPETQQRLAAIEAARVNVDAEAKRVIDALLESDSAYKKLKEQATSSEKVLKEMRDDSRIDPKTLADFSKKWIDSKSQCESAERAACQADPAYIAATEALAAAQKAQADALAEFRKALPSEPEMQALLSRAEEHRKTQSEVTQQRGLAAAELKKSESSLKSALARYQSAAGRLEQSRHDRERATALAANADSAIDAAQDAIARAQNAVFAAQREVELARRRLQEAEAAAR